MKCEIRSEKWLVPPAWHARSASVVTLWQRGFNDDQWKALSLSFGAIGLESTRRNLVRWRRVVRWTVGWRVPALEAPGSQLGGYLAAPDLTLAVAARRAVRALKVL